MNVFLTGHIQINAVQGIRVYVMSGYALQVGGQLEEKEILDESKQNSSEHPSRTASNSGFVQNVMHRGDKEVIPKFGFQERNLEGHMVVRL